MRLQSAKLEGIGLAILMASVLMVLFRPGGPGNLLGILTFASAEIGLILMVSGSVISGSFCPSNMKEIKRSEDPMKFWASISMFFVIGNVLLISIALAGPFRADSSSKNPKVIPHALQ